MPASLFLNDFTVLDYAFVDEQSGILGDSYYVSAELTGELDEKEFLLDFSVAKKMLKALVDEAFDHKLLVPMGGSATTVKTDGLTVRARDGSVWDYTCPREAFALFPDARISAEVIQYHLGRLALAKLPKNVKEARFTLRSPERFGSEANFRYTHGLRFHEGNCQRLFHGHRNPIEVYANGARAPEWEAKLAAEWAGVHFVALPTLKNLSALDLSLGVRAPGHSGAAEVEYAGSQGEFRGFIPAARVVLTEKEPSIETMSALAYQRLRAYGLTGPLRVVAFEGLNKGSSFSE